MSQSELSAVPAAQGEGRNGAAVRPVERRERLARASAARAHRNRGVGLLLFSLGVAFSLAVFLVLVVLWVSGVKLGSWTNAVGLPVFTVSLALVTRGRRMRVDGADRVLAEDVRPPIVYLRPFGADRAEIARRMSSRVRISPREGFEKTYEERRETVGELMAEAGVVLLHVGEGNGLAWEFRHVIELDAPERVILSLPL